jgi:hypothetical protein
MIGKIVSQLKSHPTLNTTAKALVKKWKQVAKHTSETNSSVNVICNFQFVVAPETAFVRI